MCNVCWKAVAAMLLLHAAAQGDQELLQKLDRQWAQMRSAVRAVRYDAPGTSVMPRDAYASDNIVLDKDETFAAGVAALIDFEKGRFRIEVRDKTFNVDPHRRLFPDTRLWTYTPGDLRCFNVGVFENPNEYSEKQADFRYEPADTWYPVLTMIVYPPFIAHGYIPGGSLGGGRYSVAPLEMKSLQLTGNGEVDGHACVVLRTPPRANSRAFLQLLVDRESGLTRRVVRYDAGVVDSQLNLSFKADGDQQILSHWSYTRLQYTLPELPPRAFRLYECTVKAFEANPTLREEDFLQEPQPGMVVSDGRRKQTFMLEPGGKQLPVDIALERRARKAQGYWYTITILAAIALLIGIVIWRRRVNSAD